jgi:hypothetical protein
MQNYSSKKCLRKTASHTSAQISFFQIGGRKNYFHRRNCSIFLRKPQSNGNKQLSVLFREWFFQIRLRLAPNFVLNDLKKPLSVNKKLRRKIKLQNF